jgi:peptidoglycan/xylan/chitin deacetylase (PgdA/CDA1 family)
MRSAAAIAVLALASAGALAATPRKVATPTGCQRHGADVARSGARTHHVVALTFDDGPWRDTPQFVRVLESKRVHATFFLIGRQVPGHGALLRRELVDGDALGNHTFSHPNLLQVGGTQAQLMATNAAIERASSYRPCVFRPPYGAYDRSITEIAAALRMTTIVWDVDPRDWSLPGTSAIVARVLAGVRNGSIVLMHDGGGPRQETLQALPKIIDALRRRGFVFETVPQLLGYKPIGTPPVRVGHGVRTP